MDGSARMNLHTTNLQTPYALAIDYENQTLYWSDYALNKLESSRTDGSNRRLLSTSLRDPYTMTFFAGRLFWTDWTYNGLYSTLSRLPSSITALLSLGVDPYGIQVIHEDVQLEGINIMQPTPVELFSFTYNNNNNNNNTKNNNKNNENSNKEATTITTTNEAE